MKQIAYFLIPLFCIVLASCSKKKGETLSPQIEVALVGNEISFEQEASTLSFSFTIHNPVSGNSITAELSDESWIKIIQVTDNLVKLSVSSNETTRLRTTLLTLKYTGAENKVIHISQKGK